MPKGTQSQGSGQTPGKGAGRASGQSRPASKATSQAASQGQQVQLDQQAIQVEMPPSALERLRSMRAGDGQRGLFTGDLSVDEFLLVKEAGFDPLGMVVGSSIYHVGYQPIYMTGSGFGMGYNYEDQELTVLTQAKYHARELAMSRLEAEADALGADGVVGVRLDTAEYEWGPDLLEFRAVGTAVRSRDGASYRTRYGKPFTSDLSGQDLRTLLQAGYRPQGLVMGTCVYVSYQNGLEFQMIAGWGWSGNNAELERFTAALYSARELAMARMQAEAQNLGAVGIVGTQLTLIPRFSSDDREFRDALNDQSHNGPPAQQWRTFTVDILAIGTAVTPVETVSQPPSPQMIVLLDQ